MFPPLDLENLMQACPISVLTCPNMTYFFELVITDRCPFYRVPGFQLLHDLEVRGYTM